MAQFLGLLRHEFRMSVRRKSIWITFGVICILLGFILSDTFDLEPGNIQTQGDIWPATAEIVYMFNMWLALIAGILAADRMQRDERFKMRELQQSAPLGRVTYMLSKYCGVTLSLLLPAWIGVTLAGCVDIALGLLPLAALPALWVEFLAISLPSIAFVTVFSLACPMVMPLRVYQILFTGYWFWGNYLNPEFFPTFSQTWLNASGLYPLQAFFAAGFIETGREMFTVLEAVANYATLALCVGIAFLVLNQVLKAKLNRA